MSLCKDLPCVRKFIRNLRGGSQPILAEASDGLRYVVKFANNLQGPNLPFNEAMGTELYRAFKLPVPEWTPLRVSDAFINKNLDCWLTTETGRLRPAAGLCFGSRFLEGDGHRLFEILPRTSFYKIQNIRDFWLAWLIDIAAGHTDNRQAIFREERDGRLTAHFVDHGHMFGGPNGKQHVPFIASRYLDSRIYPMWSTDSLLERPIMEFHRAIGIVRVEWLWRRMKDLPGEWVNEDALREFAHCIHRLEKPHLLESIHETIVDSIRQANNQIGNKRECACKSRLAATSWTGNVRAL